LRQVAGSTAVVKDTKSLLIVGTHRDWTSLSKQ